MVGLLRPRVLLMLVAMLAAPSASGSVLDMVQTDMPEPYLVDHYTGLVAVNLPAQFTCQLNPDHIMCEGFVCLTSRTPGEDPFTLGNTQDGRGFGVDDDLARDGNGDFGPYVGVFVHVDGHCQGLVLA